MPSFVSVVRRSLRGFCGRRGIRARGFSSRAARPPTQAGAEGELGIREVARLVGKKRIDWAAIQAEYIGGNIGQRRLAEKHGVPFGSLRDRAKTEGWYQLKLAAIHEAGIKAAQKTAEAASDNALTAARIKAKLLDRLEKLTDVVLMATEERSYDGDQLVAINRLRDLTAAYKDLTGDMPKAEAGEEVLQRARDILGGVESVIT